MSYAKRFYFLLAVFEWKFHQFETGIENIMGQTFRATNRVESGVPLFQGKRNKLEKNEGEVMKKKFLEETEMFTSAQFKRIMLSVVTALLLCVAAPLHATIIVGGNNNINITTGLTTLGETYSVSTDWMVDPSAYGLGAGDIIILGLDGGTGPFVDYNAFLAAGGNLILTGGSNYDPYRTWAAGYFNTTDTASGWHTDGDWHSVGSHPANQYVPADYTFANVNHTFHMLAFSDTTPNTTVYGSNDEGYYVAALREYSNGGSFNYMALDLGFRTGDETAFITPWLKGSLEAAGPSSAPVPEPASMFLLGLGLVGLAGVAKKKMKN